MSLGTYNNPTGKKNDYSPVTYSSVKFFNSESSIDPSAMSFSYWKGLLKISITPVKTGEGSAPEIDKENSIDIYLTPIKAHMFLNYIKLWKTNLDEYDNVGVSTNKGIIYLTNGIKEFGTSGDRLFIVIKILDQNTGLVKSAIAYEFSSTQYYGIINFMDSNNYSKDTSFANDAELNMFMIVLKTYVDASTDAVASTVIDNMKYDVSRLTTRISTIQEKLGIEVKNGGNNKGYRSSSYFDRDGGGSTSSSSATRSSAEQVDYNDFINDISSSMIMNDDD